MGYIEQNIGKDEKILARITHSKAGLVPAFAVAAVLIAFAVAVGYLAWYLSDLMGAEVEGFPIVAIIVCACFIGLCGVWVFVRAAVEISCNRLVVTNKRLVGQSGWIAKRTMDIILLKLDTVNASNGVFGALFHYGTLEVVSAGSQQGFNRRNQRFPYVKNTEEFRNAVLAAVDKAKEEERLAQAQAQAEAMKRVQEGNR